MSQINNEHVESYLTLLKPDSHDNIPHWKIFTIIFIFPQNDHFFSCLCPLKKSLSKMVTFLESALITTKSILIQLKLQSTSRCHFVIFEIALCENIWTPEGALVSTRRTTKIWRTKRFCWKKLSLSKGTNGDGVEPKGTKIILRDKGGSKIIFVAGTKFWNVPLLSFLSFFLDQFSSTLITVLWQQSDQCAITKVFCHSRSQCSRCHSR